MARPRKYRPSTEVEKMIQDLEAEKARLLETVDAITNAIKFLKGEN